VINYAAILDCLEDHGVEFIVIGGVAGVLHGAARLTYDVDLVYRRTSENIARLASALAPHQPYLRGAPPGLPFRWDADITIRRGLNFTLSTNLGPLDLLGEVAGVGTFDDLLPFTVTGAAGKNECHFADLPALIRMKRAAGRPKDFEAIAELERIHRER
jgi:hypothetical protein